MDFGWSSEQAELLERVRDFSTKDLARSVATVPLVGGDSEVWRRCGDFGLLGLSVPRDFGGLGLDALTTAGAIEALGRGCPDAGLVFSICAHLFACAMPVAEMGTAELKDSLLREIATGKLTAANAISEANAGSDVYALESTATREGDDYLLNGTKSFVTNAPTADVFVVYAVTNPRRGFWGISAFLVDRHSPGIRVGTKFEKSGLRSSPAATVYFDGCRVPRSRLIGAEGQGAVVFEKSMLWERACLFAAWLGVMDRQLEAAVDYARNRRQFGRTIGSNQGVSFKLVDMKLRLDAARLLLHRACWLKDSGKRADAEVALAKIAVSEAAIQSSLDAVQIHGAAGIVEGAGPAQTLADMLPGTIYSGSSEMQRQIVARSMGL